MTTSTATLTTFLLARLDEDAAVADDLLWKMTGKKPARWTFGDKIPGTEQVVIVSEWERADGEWVRNSVAVAPREQALQIVCAASPSRVLADVEAKRRIVELHQRAEDVYDADGVERPGKDCTGCWDEYPCPTLRALASVYRDHPEFQEVWA
jgi:hypothetical protein